MIKISTLVLLAVLMAAQVQAMDTVTMQVTPDPLKIGATYDGTEISVKGNAPQGSDLVLRLIGAAQDLHMKQKGKVLGLLWMNMNALSFEGAPQLYLEGSSRPLNELGLMGDKMQAQALFKDVKIEPEPEAGQRAELIDQLIALKKKEHLYQEDAVKFSLRQSGEGVQSYSARLSTPSRLMPGDYTLEVIAVKDGKYVASNKENFKVKLVGSPSFMADLAFDHGALYGVLATIIALLSGLIVGMIFNSKGEAH